MNTNIRRKTIKKLGGKFQFSYSKQIKRSSGNQNVWKRRIADSYTEMNTLIDASRLLNSTSKGSKLRALSQLDGFVSFYIYEASDKSLIVIAFLSIKYPLTFDFKWLWIEMERKRYVFLFSERIGVATIFITSFFSFAEFLNCSQCFFRFKGIERNNVPDEILFQETDSNWRTESSKRNK